MSPAEYADLLYRHATGWLGWTDAAAMRTSVHRIELALDGKADFVRKTSPWGREPAGGAGQGGTGRRPPVREGELDREAVAARMEKALALFG